MAIERLANWLLQKPAFQRQLDTLTINSLRREFPALEFAVIDGPAVRWDYLLLCGSLLVGADDEYCQRAALRIAEHCLNSRETNVAQRNAAAVILDCMANRPSIHLAQQRSLLSGEFVA